ncbi:MAG: DUF5672 family protein [Kiritimatiellae bacterium]|jgi:hypothetical protein|nr:DUF5672 family protein [Kiritimatiellia bacterium]
MKNDSCNLFEWQRENLPRLIERQKCSDQKKLVDVTVIAHWFWNDERFERDFFSIEFALRMARLCLGQCPIVLIVNKPSKIVDTLALSISADIVVKPELNQGLRSLNYDYIANLHTYFKTKYCLIVQNDGFPVRSGLEFFMDRVDYVGAPWPDKSDDWITKILLSSKTKVGNGGFSLRSHRLCVEASRLYKRKYKIIPFCYLTVDDIFYCRVLPTYESKIRKEMVFGDLDLASSFSVEYNRELFCVLDSSPLGFHGENGFSQVRGRHWLPL